MSDLHLGSEVTDSRGVGTAVPRFLGELVLPDPRPERHLVLLGDTAELDGGDHATRGRPSAIQQLDDVVGRFPDIFDALARCLRAGVTLHVVQGNHDVAFGYAAVRERLREHLGAPSTSGTAGPGALRFHRWLLYVPGLMYAEHGNQHHQLNRFPLMLRPGAGGGEAPPRTPLAAWGAQGVSRRQRAGRLLSAFAAAAVAERHAAEAGYRELVREEGVATGLPETVAGRVYDVSRFRPVPAVLSSFRGLARATGLGRRDGYLRSAAARVDDALTSVAQRPNCYIFGHTHQAALSPMARPGAYYVNCGTWSARVPGGQGDDTEDFPYVVVEHDGHLTHARLERWRRR